MNMKCGARMCGDWRIVLGLALCLAWPLAAAAQETAPDDYAGMAKLFTKVPEPPPTPDIPAAQTYVIDAGRFGITEGFLKKAKHVINGKEVVCYSDEDYHVAHNNVLGLNRAIEAGAKQGAKKILLPKGEYSFCYANIADDPKENVVFIHHDNLIVDFNGSTWKAIFDSHRRSPYDKIKPNWRENVWVTNTIEPYNMNGLFLRVSDCRNTTLRNGKVIGDKVDRDFVQQTEKSRESTYGIAAGGNCRDIVVEKFDVAFFMGDGMTTSEGHTIKSIETGFGMAWNAGSLTETGAETSVKERQTSKFIPVEAETPYFMKGYGYTQGMSGLRRGAYDVFVYDTDKRFVETLGTVPVLRAFTVPRKGAFVRLVVDETTVDKDGWQMQLYKGTYGSHITFRDNYIHHGHRGGMTIGVNDMLIVRNRFYNNGEWPDKENNLPGFEQENGNSFMTRYHINMEDSKGHNIYILNNTFDNGRLNLALRGPQFWIEGNTFTNNGMVFYRVNNAVLKNNIIRNGSFGTFPYDHKGPFGLYVRNWIIDGNEIDGLFEATGDAPLRSVINNTISKGFKAEAPIETFRNNTLKLNEDVGYNALLTMATIARVENCRFIKDEGCKARNVIDLGTTFNTKKGKAGNPALRMEFCNCVFERIKMNAEEVDFSGCTFTDAGLATKTGLGFHDCTFTQGKYELLNNYGGNPNNTAVFFLNKGANLLFKSCTVTATGPHPIFASPQNQTLPVDASFEKTKVEHKGTGSIGLKILGGAVTLTDSHISSEQTIEPLKQEPKLVRSRIGK